MNVFESITFLKIGNEVKLAPPQQPDANDEENIPPPTDYLVVLPLPTNSGREDTIIASQEYVDSNREKTFNRLAFNLGIIKGENAIISGKLIDPHETYELDDFTTEKLIEPFQIFDKFVDKKLDKQRNVTRIQEHFIDANLDLNLRFNLHKNLGMMELIPSEQGHPGILRLITNSDLKYGSASLVSNLNEFVLSGTDVSYTFDTCFRYEFNDRILDTDLEDFIGFGDSDEDIPNNGAGLSIVNEEFVFMTVQDGHQEVVKSGIVPNVGTWYHLTVHVAKSNDESYFELNDKRVDCSMVLSENPVGIQYLIDKSSYVEGSIYLDIDYCNITIEMVN